MRVRHVAGRDAARDTGVRLGCPRSRRPPRGLRAALLTLVVLLSACGASGPVYQPAPQAAPSQAIIYVYRPKTLFNWGGSPGVHLDGKLMFDIRAGGYVKLDVTPGPHRVEVKGRLLLDDWYPGPVGREVNAEGGKTYYLRIRPVGTVNSMGDSVMVNSGAEFIELPAELAEPELSAMKLSR